MTNTFEGRGHSRKEGVPEDSGRDKVPPSDDGNDSSWKWLAVVLALVFIILLYVILKLWPPPLEDGVLPQGSQVRFLIWEVWVTNEIRLPVLALAAGAMGGVIKGFTAISKHVSRQDFERRWLAWYILRPMIGAGLGITIYLLARGGLAFDTTAEQISAFTVAGIAVLVGVFAEEAMEMLKGIAGKLFAKASKVGRRYNTGETVPVSGSYKALPHECEKKETAREVRTFTKNEKLGAHECGKPVDWELIRET